MSHFGRMMKAATPEESGAGAADAANQNKMTGDMIAAKAVHAHGQADKHLAVAKDMAAKGDGAQAQQSAQTSNSYRQAGLHYDAAGSAHNTGAQDERNAHFAAGNKAQGQADDMAMAAGTPDK